MPKWLTGSVTCLVVFVLLTGCDRKRTQVESHLRYVPPPPIVTCTDTIAFRISFSPDGESVLSSPDDKEPKISSAERSKWLPNLKREGFVINNHMQLKRFGFTPSQLYNTGKTDSIQVITRPYRADELLPADYRIEFKKGRRRISFVFEGINYEVKFATADIIPGGYPELLVYTYNHIMNGDNFDLYIFSADKP